MWGRRQQLLAEYRGLAVARAVSRFFDGVGGVAGRRRRRSCVGIIIGVASRQIDAHGSIDVLLSSDGRRPTPRKAHMSRAAEWVDDLSHDTRLGLRALRRNPGFTLSAVLVLAVGIGLNLAFLHVVKATLSGRLPFRDADTLVRIVRQSPEEERWALTMTALRFYRENTNVFSYIVAERLITEPVQVQQDDEDAGARFVSGNYFVDLGVVARLGRVFGPADDRPGAPPVALLSEGYWQRRFGGDPAVVSRTVTIHGNSVLILGVLPTDFVSVAMRRADVWLPDASRIGLLGTTGRPAGPEPTDTALVAQPRPGVSRDAVSAQLGALDGELRRRQPSLSEERDVVRARPISEDERRGNGLPIATVLVFLVLLTSCANLGNMMLARGVARRREIEARVAMGATRSRLVRQLMTEALLLSALGAAAGLVLAGAGGRLLVANFAGQLNVRVTTDVWIVASAAVLALVCAVAFGLAPARHVSRQRPPATRARQTLVAVQVATSCLLLVLAGLLVRGSQRQLALAGRADHMSILVVEPQLNARAFPGAAARAAIDDMAARIRAIADVLDVAAATDPVYAPAVLSTDGAPVVLQSRVDPAYFGVMGIAVLRGRVPLPGERGVAVISRSAEQAVFEDEDALGRLWPPGGGAATVVGIVEDTVLARLRDARAVESYVSLDDDRVAAASIIVRTQRDARSVLRRARAAASMPGAEPSVWLLQRPIDQLLQHSLAASRMIGALGAVAAGLAAFGVFGLLTFAVRERTRELAVRRALGARPYAIASLLLWQYVTPLAAGVVAGAMLATFAAKAMIGVNAGLGLDTSLDSAGYLLGVATFGLALLAAVFPAVRGATRVDPAVALRAD
jgi:predicted permease